MLLLWSPEEKWMIPWPPLIPVRPDIESDLDSESNDEDENDENVVSDSDDSSNQ